MREINFHKLQRRFLQRQTRTSTEHIVKRISFLSLYNLLQSDPWFLESFSENTKEFTGETCIVDVRSKDEYFDFRLRGALHIENVLLSLKTCAQRSSPLLSFIVYGNSNEDETQRVAFDIVETVGLCNKVYVLSNAFSTCVATYEKFSSLLVVRGSANDFPSIPLRLPSTILNNGHLYLAYHDVFPFLVSNRFHHFAISTILDISITPLIENAVSPNYTHIAPTHRDDSSSTGSTLRVLMDAAQLKKAAQCIELGLNVFSSILVVTRDSPTAAVAVVIAYLMLYKKMSFQLSFLYLLNKSVDVDWGAPQVNVLRSLEGTPSAQSAAKSTEDITFSSTFSLFDKSLAGAKDFFRTPGLFDIIDQVWNVNDEIGRILQIMNDERDEWVENFARQMACLEKDSAQLNNDATTAPNQRHMTVLCSVLYNATSHLQLPPVYSSVTADAQESLNSIIKSISPSPTPPPEYDDLFVPEPTVTAFSEDCYFLSKKMSNTPQFSESFKDVDTQHMLPLFAYYLKSYWLGSGELPCMRLHPFFLPKYVQSVSNGPQPYENTLREAFLCLLLQHINVGEEKSSEPLDIMGDQILNGFSKQDITLRELHIVGLIFTYDGCREHPRYIQRAKDFLPHVLKISSDEWKEETPRVMKRTVCLILYAIGLHMTKQRDDNKQQEDRASTISTHALHSVSDEIWTNKFIFLTQIIYRLCHIWFSREHNSTDDVKTMVESPAFLLKGIIYAKRLINSFFQYAVEHALKEE